MQTLSTAGIGQATKELNKLLFVDVKSITGVGRTKVATITPLGIGQGIEKTSPTGVTAPNLKLKTPKITTLTTKTLQTTPRQKAKVRLTTSQAVGVEQITRQKVNLNQLGKQVTKQKQPLRTKTGTRQISIQKQSQRLKLVTPTITDFPPPTILPRIPTSTIKPFRIRPRLSGTKQRTTRGLFTVSERRRGTFRPIATTKDLNKALSIGARRTRTTLGATFRVSRGRGRGIGGIGTPAGFRRKETSLGTLFIEPRKQRLGSVGEIIEIQTARKQRKGGIF